MTTFTPDDVSRIVRAVLERVRQQAPAAPAPAARPAPAGAAPSPTGPAAGVAIPEKVVTAAALVTVPGGVRIVSVRHDAVITPSARDRAREGGFELVRAAKGHASAPSAGRAFFVGSAECPGDASGRSSGVVRAVPGAARLPATGLADVVAALSLHVTRDGARGLLLAGRPHAACALANRSPGVRAVTARDAATLLAAVAECAANVVVVHPRDFSGTGLERVAVALAAGSAPLPAELAPPPACPCGGPSPTACGCGTHTH